MSRAWRAADSAMDGWNYLGYDSSLEIVFSRRFRCGHLRHDGLFNYLALNH
jgi:hypothetical protein